MWRHRNQHGIPKSQKRSFGAFMLRQFCSRGFLIRRAVDKLEVLLISDPHGFARLHDNRTRWTCGCAHTHTHTQKSPIHMDPVPQAFRPHPFQKRKAETKWPRHFCLNLASRAALGSSKLNAKTILLYSECGESMKSSATSWETKRIFRISSQLRRSTSLHCIP